jgi:iron(III) transport system substrate-binding protein
MAQPLLAAFGFALLLGACTPPRPATPGAAPAAPAATAPASQTGGPAESLTLDALAEQARAEGGTLSLYGSLNTNTAAKVFPAFEARFPGIKVDWVDGTGERLMTRIATEARGGKVLVDVIQTNLEHLYQLRNQGLLVDFSVPEAASLPESARGTYWLASDLKFYVVAWNTNLVSPDEEPRQLDDLADARWRNRIIADPADVEYLIVMSRQKYRNDERGLDLLRKIGQNAPEFHTGHSELAELLVAGQGAVCMTCFSHHFPPRIRRGAPVNYLLAEGVGLISANALPRDVPHPKTAELWIRWVATEEAQQVYAEAGATPALSTVPPIEKTRPDTIYALGANELPEYPRYLRQWQEVFGLR